MIYIRWGFFREDQEEQADPRRETHESQVSRQALWERRQAQRLAQKRLVQLEEEWKEVEQALERVNQHKHQMEQEQTRLEREHQENLKSYEQRERFLASIRVQPWGEEGGTEP